jgi:hypothetical protein
MPQQVAGLELAGASPAPEKASVKFILVGNTVRRLLTKLLEPAKIAYAVGSAILQHLAGDKIVNSASAAKRFLSSERISFEQPHLAEGGASAACRLMASREVYLWDPFLFDGHRPSCPHCRCQLLFDTVAQTARLIKGIGFTDCDRHCVTRRWKCPNGSSKNVSGWEGCVLGCSCM